MQKIKRSFETFGEYFKGTIILTSEQNIYYFSGFRTTARRPKQIGLTAVILAPNCKKMIAPKKWELQIREENNSDIGELITYDNTIENFYDTLLTVIRPLDTSILWFEKDFIELNTYLKLQSAFPLSTLQNICPIIAKLRLIKDSDELSRIRTAAKVAVNAMEHAKTILAPGISELDAVAEIEYHMRKNGSDGMPFTMKLLSGLKSSVITQVPGKKIIETGDLVLIDFGAICDGYSSDWTRTFGIKEVSKEQEDIYNLVWTMERECIKLVKSQLPMSKLVERVTEIAKESPYGKYYNPHLGHSVGITSHEWPIIDPNVTETLEENMVITIEPGVYVPGIGGVRIEDEILVKKDGYEILTGLKQEGLLI